VLIGLSVDDTTADLDFMVKKLLSVRVFDSTDSALAEGSTSSAAAANDDATSEPRKMWAKSVTDIGGEILCGREEVNLRSEIMDRGREIVKEWPGGRMPHLTHSRLFVGLVVSQFTLYGQVIKGSKPDFHLSMKSDTSRAMYHDFLDRLRKAYHPDRIKGTGLTTERE
jgi:D-tyrosyl-tRNA(Tyr) deacylase